MKISFLMRRTAEGLPVVVQGYMRWLGGVDMIGEMEDVYNREGRVMDGICVILPWEVFLVMVLLLYPRYIALE